MNTAIIKTDWQHHCSELHAIRQQVFMQEQQVAAEDEWDGLDESATHFLVLADGQAIGCARLLYEEKTEPLHKPAFHIGRVALLAPWRGQGLGQQLMQTLITHCQQLTPAAAIYLHAQCERQGFYERLGFIAKGDVFMDAGIAHIAMYWEQAHG